MSNTSQNQVEKKKNSGTDGTGKENVNAKVEDPRLAKLRENLAKLKEAKKEQSTGFLKISSGETKILEFTGDMEPVQRTFKRKNEKTGEEEASSKIMYAYKVIDLNNQDAGIVTWEISRSWSDNVDNLLSKEFTTLEIKRTGSSTDTTYLMAPYLKGRDKSF